MSPLLNFGQAGRLGQNFATGQEVCCRAATRQQPTYAPTFAKTMWAVQFKKSMLAIATSPPKILGNRAPSRMPILIAFAMRNQM
jgi:hypothetical protein